MLRLRNKETFWNIGTGSGPILCQLILCVKNILEKKRIFKSTHKNQFLEHAFNILSTENIDFCSVYSFLCCVLYDKRNVIFVLVLPSSSFGFILYMRSFTDEESCFLKCTCKAV